MSYIIIKDAFKNDYISREAGERLRLIILNAIKNKEELVLDFENLIVASTSFFDESIAKLSDEAIEESVFSEYVTLKNLNKNDLKVLTRVNEYRGFNIIDTKPGHPWRLCPLGEHWVNEHIRISKKGKKAEVDGHCRKNPKGKDLIKSEELIEMARKHFNKLKKMPTPNNLKFPKGNEFDEIIAGWCAYWNEVLKPEQELDPDIVKVLIATESGFEPSPKVSKGHLAIGIMQLMPETILYLRPDRKELRDHFLDIDEEDAKDPIVNIAAGTRWLFRKYELTKLKLKRKPSWEEVLYDYKGITKDESLQAQKIRESVNKYLKELSL